jgi:hypothetical protein
LLHAGKGSSVLRLVLLVLLSNTMWGEIISWNASSDAIAFEITNLRSDDAGGINVTILPAGASEVPSCPCPSAINILQNGTMAWSGTVGGVSYSDQYADGWITAQGTLPPIQPTDPLNNPMHVGFSVLWQFTLNLYTGPNNGFAGPMGDTLLTTVTGSGAGWSEGLLELRLDPGSACGCPYWQGNQFTYSSATPEPSTLGLSLAGIVGLLLLQRSIKARS